MPAASFDAVPAVTADGRVVRPEFTGSAKEYFRIWIVNLFFTLITLGVYSAWAKVRKKRYFYGSTRLDGDTFDYFGSPKTILKGRIIAVLVFVIYAFLTELYPVSSYALWALFLIVLPWLVVRALAFNARNSAYRGLRFDFSANLRDAVRVYIGMPVAVLLSLGLAYPWFVARQKEFVISRHVFGKSGFTCSIPAGDLFAIYLLAGLMLMGLVIIPIAMMMGFAAASQTFPQAVTWLGFGASMVLLYGAYAVVYAYTQARTTNLMWDGTRGPGMRFSSSLKATKLARLYIGNLAAIAVTAGLLIPWAVIRTLRYRFENFAMVIEEERVHEASPVLERVGATGQELGDIFNLDLGL